MARADAGATPSQERPFAGRIVAFDLARGLAVLFMVLVHVLGHYGNDSAWASPIGQVVIFFGGPTAAPVFMFLMGASLAFSRRSTPRDVARRGLWLLALAYTLNVLRGGLPASLGLATRYVTESQIAPYTPATLMTIVDIHQLAGLALFVLAGLVWLAPRARLPLPGLAVALAVVVGLVSPALWGRTSGVAPLDLGLALLWGTDWNVFFPLFPWLVYPLVGFVYGRFVTGGAEPRRAIRRAGAGGLALGLVGAALIATRGAPIAVTDYWRQAPAVLLAIVGLVVAWLALADLVVERIRPRVVVAVLEGWSGRVTSMYCLHWILIGWGVGLVGHRQLDLAGVVVAMVVVLMATDRITAALPFLRGRGRGRETQPARLPAPADA